MTDAALENALARRKGIVADIAQQKRDLLILQEALFRAEADLAKVSEFINTWHEMAGIQPPEFTEHCEFVPNTILKRAKNPDREYVAEQALQIIKSAGRPLGRKEIYEALARKGIAVRGKDPEMVLSTMLWRSKEKIVRLPRHGYWPADEEYRAAGYNPDHDDLLGVAADGPEGWGP